MAITITIIVFITFPLVISVICGIHKREYLLSYPTDNQISVKIVCDIDRIGGSGSIGNEWTYEHYLNDKEFEDGEIVTVSAKDFFSITSRFIEHDNSINDVGESTSQRYRYSDNDNYKKTIIISQKVHVVEQGGRRYAGSTADFNVIYKLKRVIPTTMSYWDVFLYTSNATEYFLCVFLIGAQILFVVFIIFIVINGRDRQTQIEKQERHRREQEFLAEKAAFLERLQGQNIRQIAGVPDNVSFVNDFPVDNNDALYGSFTVYCSNNGSCYHDKMGCCSARKPAHYFDAKKKFRPCSKCCTKPKSIPKWYIDYTALKNQANYYQINIEE